MLRYARPCLAILLLASTTQAQTKPTYDLVIKDGRIVNGTGNPWFHGDLAIIGDRIVAVGRLPEGYEAKRVIDARGLVVAPGFIDMHSHSDWTLIEDGAAQSKIRQGVTTEMLGEHSSVGPFAGKLAPKVLKVAGSPVEIRTIADYFAALEKSGTSVNVATYAGLGNVWGSVMGESFDRPTRAQMDEMAKLLDRAIDDGAYGLSTMLADPQERVTTADDLAYLGQVLKKRGAIFSSHIRNEGTDVLRSVGEIISVAEQAGIRADVIHIKIADQRLWGKMSEVVALIDEARARGVDIQANVYPYTRGNNDLVSILPPWAHEGGTEALLKRLGEPSLRARMKADINGGLPGWYNRYLAVGGDWSRMLISAKLSEKNKVDEGKTMDVILARRAKESAGADPLDLMFDFLVDENGSVGTIYAHHTEADMNLAMHQPWCSIGSDGTALAVEGPLRKGHPHPRSFGTFPRILGEYVRDKHLLTLEDAVRKMTSLNAEKIGLKERGQIQPGWYADITVFDPAKIADRSTFLEPFAYSVGVRHVVVNGQPALTDGEPTPARAGKGLRKGR